MASYSLLSRVVNDPTTRREVRFPPARHRGYNRGMSDQQKRDRLVGVLMLNFALIVWYLVGGGPIALITTLFIAALAIGGWLLWCRTA